MPAVGKGLSIGSSRAAQEDAVLSEQVKKSNKGKSKGKGKAKSKRPPTVTPAKLEAERVALLAEKQAQLAAVLDNHDTLIREKFHMETFVTMVEYDPEIAKQDESQVFKNYKAQYDLLDTAAPISTSPRKTRSSHAGGLLGIAGPSIPFSRGGSSVSVSAPSPRQSPVKFPAKPLAKENSTDVFTNGHSGLNINGKGKEKAVDAEPEPESISVNLARNRSAARKTVNVAPRTLRKRPGAPADPAESLHSTTEIEATDHPPRKRRKVDADIAMNVSDILPDTTSISAPVNGRVLRGQRKLQELPPSSDVAQDQPRDPTLGGKTTVPVGRVMPHRTAAHRPMVSAPPLPHRRAAVTAPSGVKRVKLLVRRPPPKNLSHPKQRPPPPQFNSSLSAFLGSWIGVAGQTFPVDAEQDVGNSEVLHLAQTEAALLERVEGMKRAGKWFGSDLFDTFRAGAAEATGSGSGIGTPFDASASADNSGLTAVHSTPNDPWAAVVRSVIAYGAKNRPNTNSAVNSKSSRRTRGAAIAFQVAGKIQAYWDGETAKLEKGRLVEEKRLRGVAKTVMKLVIGEWKKAVFHIRELERLKLEAEELKRGHEHLDAILDQSGQILETQQGDLTRGTGTLSRSRSSSVSATIMGWGEEDEDDGDDEEEDEGQEEGDDIDEDRDENNQDATMEGDEDEGEDGSNATNLLADHPQTPDSTTSSLPDPSTPLLDSQTVSQSHSPAPSAQDEAMDSDDEDVTSVDAMINDLDPSSPIHPPPASDVSTPGLGPADYDMGHAKPQSTHSHTPAPSSPHPNESDEADAASGDPGSLRPSSSGAPLSPEPTGSIDDAKPPVDPSQNDTADGVDTSMVDADPLPFADNTTPKDTDSKAAKAAEESDDDDDDEEEGPQEPVIPAYLRPYAVAPVEWDEGKKVTPPPLLRGVLRPYQQSGLEWLASLHLHNMNGILADEMGLGKTIQTISLLAHLACDRGIWGPHLIIVPTSVLLNWEMEFKKFLPGFKVLSYHGSTKRRKELRQGWNEKHHFNVCITSYTLASRDALVFKRKPWYYMILDEAHMLKNFKSQRWNTLLMFRSFRRLLLTGTPLQNNLTELWALLQFLMSGSDFVNLKEFGDWFSNPLEKAIESGNTLDDDTKQRVSKLHTVLRPYLLRRLKSNVEKELPSKYEHLVLCPLSKRQRFLYDEFMSRAHTRDALQSGVYQKIANILMQLRKVCNHPDLFEVRPIVTSFAMERSAVADFEIKELLIRRRLQIEDEETINMELLGLRFLQRQGTPLIAASETRRLDGTTRLPFISEIPDAPPPKDTRTIAGFRAYSAYQRHADTISRWAHIGYLNRMRCNAFPIYSHEVLTLMQRFYSPLLPLSAVDTTRHYFDTVYPINAAIKSYATRADEMGSAVDRFAFVTPAVVALDMPRIALVGHTLPVEPGFDDVLHRASVKLQIAFPDPSLLQYDCGKMQELARLLREKKAGGHRILIFTQMTKILDILEIFLNFHGYLYLRLDGATKIEDRQYITERFNADSRIFCFIASSRSGGVGINLTGADTVVFYDSDFNPQMDRQCEDRAHRIGQIRDVHIYRFVSQHTVEEAMLRKANQKRSLDDMVIQKGEFDWRSLFADDNELTHALGEFEDTEDAHAAAVAAREEVVMEGRDKADFALDGDLDGGASVAPVEDAAPQPAPEVEEPEEEPEEGGSVADYMIAFVQRDLEFFREWRL